MLFKVLIKRRFKDGKTKEIHSLLNEIRSEAMNIEGYISGETLMSLNDTRTLMVISTWKNLESWQAWKDSNLRKDHEARLSLYQDGQTQFEEYILPTLNR